MSTMTGLHALTRPGMNARAQAWLMLAVAPLAWSMAWAVPAAEDQAAVPSAAASVQPLRMAQQLTQDSLAGNSARQQLLEALHGLLAAHPDVLKARSAAESAGHDLSTAKGARWPSFKVGTSSGNATLGQSQSQRRESYNALNAEVRLNLLDGGAIDSGIRSAEEMQAAQDSMLYSTQQNVLLEALTSLLELHRFDRKSRIAAESAETIGQLAHVEERRAELGAVGRNDLRRAASRQASALAQQHGLQSERMDAQARFTRYFNYTPAGNGLPDLQVPGPWMPVSEQAALQTAENHSAELRETGHLIARASAEVERSKAQRFPTLAATVAKTHDPKGVLYNAGTRYGVELNWNFGNGFELRDRILKAINELQAQQAQQESVRRQVQETASAAWGRWQAGRQREAQLTQAVREARFAFEGYRRLLEVGRGSLAQVLDAQLDMQRLMLDEADALYDQRINELRLVRTTGQLLPKELPAHWLDQLFAQSAPASELPGRGSAMPAAQAALTSAPLDAAANAGPVVVAQRLQLRLETRLDAKRWPRPSPPPPLTSAMRW